MTLDDLNIFLDQFLLKNEAIERIDPTMANGLQVRGKTEIKTIVTGVSASLRFLEQAAADGADAVVVHHGLSLPESVHFEHLFTQRLRFLWEHDMSLFGYHYLLDSHPVIGNNVQIIRHLGGQPVAPYGRDGWGWLGEFGGGADRDDLMARCTTLFSHTVAQYPFGPPSVNRMVALSGSGSPRARDMDWLLENGVGLYVTGEAREWTREYCREMGLSLVAGGHYNSERLGVIALTQELRDRWEGVAVRFLDVPNPV